jgi:hypothetical protein
MRSFYTWLFVCALSILALFNDKPWKPLEVFDSDAGGYYVYLPSAFIYGDLGRADSLNLLQSAQLAPKMRLIGLVPLPNGKFISKYPLGVALADVPWFLGAHAYARLTGKPADGLSRPYQQAIMLAGLVHALLGLWVVRKLLRRYFDDGTTAWALAGIALGTNYFAYATYNSSLAHAPLFLWQAALLYCTARWYEDVRPRDAWGLGLFLGLAVLTRPTEILFGLVPLAWGLTSRAAVQQRLALWRRHAGPLVAAGGIFLAVVSLQLWFWHAVSGHWVLYTYTGERFDFAHPHLLEGLFSFKKGWLLYTPLAGVALLGTWALRGRLRAAVPAIVVLVPVLVYVTFSWEQWWYGGGFSARPLVSLYPLLALPLAALLARPGRWQLVVRTVVALLTVLSMWQTYQYAAGIIHYENNTAELYFRNFFHPSL